MNREQILARAALYQQYRDTKEVTLKGEAIVEFARDLLAEQEREIMGKLDSFQADYVFAKEAVPPTFAPIRYDFRLTAK